MNKHETPLCHTRGYCMAFCPDCGDEISTESEGVVVEVGMLEMNPGIFVSVVSIVTEDGLINVPIGPYILTRTKEDK